MLCNMLNDATNLIRLKDAAEARLGYPFRGAVKEVPSGSVAVVQIKNADPEQGVDWPALVRTELTGRKRPDWLRSGDVLFAARGNRNVAVLVDQPPAMPSVHRSFICCASAVSMSYRRTLPGTSIRPGPALLCAVSRRHVHHQHPQGSARSVAHSRTQHGAATPHCAPQRCRRQRKAVNRTATS